MKIFISKQGLEPQEIEVGDGCYIDFTGNVGIRQRQPVELVTTWGIIGIDMEASGLVAGIQVQACDPADHPVWDLIQNSPQIVADGKCQYSNKN
jgi:hypothetical protein